MSFDHEQKNGSVCRAPEGKGDLPNNKGDSTTEEKRQGQTELEKLFAQVIADHPHKGEAELRHTLELRCHTSMADPERRALLTRVYKQATQVGAAPPIASPASGNATPPDETGDHVVDDTPPASGDGELCASPEDHDTDDHLPDEPAPAGSNGDGEPPAQAHPGANSGGADTADEPAHAQPAAADRESIDMSDKTEAPLRAHVPGTIISAAAQTVNAPGLRLAALHGMTVLPRTATVNSPSDVERGPLPGKPDDHPGATAGANGGHRAVNSIERATQVRLKLRKAGYLPIPVAGKNPVIKEWTKQKDTGPRDYGLWAKDLPYATNTGVLTARMPTFDGDILNPEASAAVKDLVRERFGDNGHFLERIGLPPKRAFPFQTAKPFEKIQCALIGPNSTGPNSKDEKIEFLGDGQHIVVDGIHPDTKKPYVWFGGELGDVKLEELPCINEAEARQLVRDAVDLLVNGARLHHQKSN